MECDLNITDDLISENFGIIPRTIFSLFQDFETEAQEFLIKISYIELYNDLFSSDDSRESKVLDEGILTGHEEISLRTQLMKYELLNKAQLNDILVKQMIIKIRGIKKIILFYNNYNSYFFFIIIIYVNLFFFITFISILKK